MTIENIHTTAVAINGSAILLLGAPGSGKSDLALRLIMNKNAVLISDDRTDIELVNGVLKASCPQNIQGLLEVRGIGICKFPFLPSAEVRLAVRLVSSFDEIERLPQPETAEFCGVKIRLVRIYPFEASAADKIIAACYQNQ